VTPAEVLAARAFDPFCANGVLATVHALADFSHSNAMGQLVAAGRYRAELLITLGKVAPPRYASLIGRYRDDADPAVRRGVAVALGLIDNEAVAVPVLVQLLARSGQPQDFLVQWDAAASLATIARRSSGEGVRRRLAELLRERDALTVALAARALAATGDPWGSLKLRELARHADPRVREEALLALGELAEASAAEAARGRLDDDSLAVRAAAVYALGRTGGPAAVPVLRTAIEAALEYERELERRKAHGESERMLRERQGLGVYDLRETLQRALAAAAAPARR